MEAVEEVQVFSLPVADEPEAVTAIEHEAERIKLVGRCFATASPAERQRLLRWVNAAFREDGGRR